MSMELMVQAMKTKVGNPLRKLVLIKLADNANDKGECWPSYQNIADLCEIDKRTAQRHVAALCEMGLLRKETRVREYGNTSNMYVLTMRGGTESPMGRQKVTPGAAQSHPESVKEPVKETNTIVDDIDHEGFVDCYNEIIDAFQPNWMTVKDLSPKRKRMIKSALSHVKTRAKEVDREPMDYLIALLRAMAVDREFYSGHPSPTSRGFRCSLETNLRPDRISQAIDKFAGD